MDSVEDVCVAEVADVDSPEEDDEDVSVDEVGSLTGTEEGVVDEVEGAVVPDEGAVVVTFLVVFL